jgi:hypothetical protein
MSTTYRMIVRAPKGGIEWRGEQYRGGQYLPEAAAVDLGVILPVCGGAPGPEEVDLAELTDEQLATLAGRIADEQQRRGPAMPARVTVPISAKQPVKNKYASTAPKQWAKTVEHVPADAANGHDWEGQWLTRGAKVDLAPGDLYLETDIVNQGARMDVDLYVVCPDGSSSRIGSADSKGWAQALRLTAREYLALSPAERLRKAEELD